MKFVVYKKIDEDSTWSGLILGSDLTDKIKKCLEVTEDDIWYTLEAATREEAKYIFNIRSGFTDLLDLGEPAKCSCGELYYPERSGVCWKCGTKHV